MATSDLLNSMSSIGVPKEIKADARILKSIKSNIPLNLLLSVGLFETDKLNHGHVHVHETRSQIKNCHFAIKENF